MGSAVVFPQTIFTSTAFIGPNEFSAWLCLCHQLPMDFIVGAPLSRRAGIAS
jgi:hypothetical protein